MALIILPLIALFSIILLPIPYVGKNISAAFLISAAIAVVIGGQGLGNLLPAIIKGIDSVSWVIFLITFASVYTQSQFALGSVETVLDVFRGLFGKSTKGLVVAILLTLTLAGSLIGSATATASVIGILVISILNEIELKPNQIGAILLMGSIIGSIMPPITSAVFMTTSLMDIAPEPVVNISYFTTAIALLIAIYTSTRFVKIKEMPKELIPKESTWEIVTKNWTNLVPLTVFALIVFLRAGLSIDLLKPTDILWNFFKGIPILQAFTNRFVQAVIVGTLITMCYPRVLRNTKEWFSKGIASAKFSIQNIVCVGIMIGAFNASGMIDSIVELTQGMPSAGLKIGGGITILLMGMLTGAQSTTLTTMVPILAPILVNVHGVSATKAAVGFANLGMAGQSFPPVDILGFMLAGIVASSLNKPADGVKIMLLSLPVTLWFAIVGFGALFI